MVYSNCGKELDDETMFCESCGTKVIRQTGNNPNLNTKNFNKYLSNREVKGRKTVKLIYNNDFVDFQYSDTYYKRIIVSSISAVFVELKKASDWLLFFAICFFIASFLLFQQYGLDNFLFFSLPLLVWGISFLLAFIFSNEVRFGIRSDGREYSISEYSSKELFDKWVLHKDILSKLVVEARTRNGKL